MTYDRPESKFAHNTHWYKSISGQGWTTLWEWAEEGEIDRLGLHDCAQQNCETLHQSSSRDFIANTVYAAEVARVARAETKVVRKKPKRKAHNS